MPRRLRRWRPRRPTTRRRIFIGLAVAGGVLALLGLAAGWRVFNAGRDLRAAESLLRDAGDLIESGQLAEGRQKLTEASGKLTSAQSTLANKPELDVFGPVPIIGDNLDELERSVGLATQLVSGGLRILTAAKPLEGPDGRLEVPLRGGAIPLDAVRATQRETELLVQTLPVPDEIDDPGFLIGPVKTLYDKVHDETIRRREQLEALADGLAIIEDMAGGNGDRFYLIAVANTAEMRGTGGMILSYGGLIGRNGRFELTDFGRIDDLLLRAPIDTRFVPDLPEDYLRRWDGFDPLLRWRNANLAADMKLIGPVLAAMFGSKTGVGIDGVIQIDPQGLAAMVAGTGPVQVPQLGTVDATNLVPTVLSDAYARFPGIERRSDVLRDVAKAVFQKLVTGSYESLRPLGTALAAAVDGRHVMVWSPPAAPLTERVRSFRADGSLPDLDGPDAVHLTVQNVSGNKLDYFVDTDVDLTGERFAGRIGKVQATITVTNGAAPGVTTPKYVYGPFNEDQEAGLYRGVVSLYLPRGAELVGTSGDPPRDPPQSVTEDGRPVVSYTVDLPAGQTHRVVLDLDLAPRSPGPYELLLVPSARVRPTTVHTDLELGGSRLVDEVVLDRTWRLRQEQRPQSVHRGRQEEASMVLGAYGMLRTSWWYARTPTRTRRDET